LTSDAKRRKKAKKMPEAYMVGCGSKDR
jgi:hypothetical protein